MKIKLTLYLNPPSYEKLLPFTMIVQRVKIYVIDKKGGQWIFNIWMEIKFLKYFFTLWMFIVPDSLYKIIMSSYVWSYYSKLSPIVSEIIEILVRFSCTIISFIAIFIFNPKQRKRTKIFKMGLFQISMFYITTLWASK